MTAASRLLAAARRSAWRPARRRIRTSRASRRRSKTVTRARPARDREGDLQAAGRRERRPRASTPTTQGSTGQACSCVALNGETAQRGASAPFQHGGRSASCRRSAATAAADGAAPASRRRRHATRPTSTCPASTSTPTATTPRSTSRASTSTPTTQRAQGDDHHRTSNNEQRADQRRRGRRADPRRRERPGRPHAASCWPRDNPGPNGWQSRRLRGPRAASRPARRRDHAVKTDNHDDLHNDIKAPAHRQRRQVSGRLRPRLTSTTL